MASHEVTRISVNGVSSEYKEHNERCIARCTRPAHLAQTNPITLARFVLEETENYHKGRPSLAFILQSIGVAAKVISNGEKKAGMQGLFALGGEVNVQGEDQKKLDVLANDVFINALVGSKKVRSRVCMYALLLCECECASASALC